MSKKKGNSQSTDMANNATKRFSEFSDEQLANAVRLSHIDTPLDGIVEILENVLARIHNHPEIDDMIKDEFFNDLRSFSFYKALIVD